MSPDESKGRTYRVVYSAKIQTDLKTLALLATTSGLGHEFLASLRKMDQGLGRDPKSFGCPWFTLQTAQLVVHSRLLPPIHVVYGIHLNRPIVFVRSVTWSEKV